ncbi:hypothetical protein FOZ62_026533, partial [Perkinsus olseni]
MYDPQNTGYVNMDTVKEFFGSAGYGALSDDDTKAILQAADADGDGKLGLEDFRKLIPIGQGALKTEDAAEDSDRRASPTVAVPVDTTLTPPPTPKTGERPRMVSQASSTVLHNSMVTRYGERMLDDGVVSYSLLESMGMWIGERLGKQELETMYPEQKASLERDDLAVKNVCKHLWPRLYGKQADRLQTDNRGSYVIHDNGFAPIEEVVKAGVNYNDVEATPPHVVNRIKQTLELPKGIIAGYLAALGHPCYVGYFDITEAPVVGGCCFKVTMAADAEQQPPTFEVTAKEDLTPTQRTKQVSDAALTKPLSASGPVSVIQGTPQRRVSLTPKTTAPAALVPTLERPRPEPTTRTSISGRSAYRCSLVQGMTTKPDARKTPLLAALYERVHWKDEVEYEAPVVKEHVDSDLLSGPFSVAYASLLRISEDFDLTPTSTVTFTDFVPLFYWFRIGQSMQAASTVIRIAVDTNSHAYTCSLADLQRATYDREAVVDPGYTGELVHLFQQLRERFGGPSGSRTA